MFLLAKMFVLNYNNGMTSIWDSNSTIECINEHFVVYKLLREIAWKSFIIFVKVNYHIVNDVSDE